MADKELTTLVISEKDFSGNFVEGSSVILCKPISDQIRAAGHKALVTLEGQSEAYNAQLLRPQGNKGKYYVLIGNPVGIASSYIKC